jgi:hypothetical protein
MEEKQQINKHPWSFFLQKYKRPIFIQMGSQNLNRVFLSVESDDSIFIQELWLSGGVSPFFEKMKTFFQALNFVLVAQKLINLIYFAAEL